MDADGLLLQGSRFVNKMARLADHSTTKNLQPTTKMAISREVARRERDGSNDSTAARQWKHLALCWSRSKAHYLDQINVCTREHMSCVDPYDGQAVRRGGPNKNKEDNKSDEDLLVVSPGVDGRLKDEAQIG